MRKRIGKKVCVFIAAALFWGLWLSMPAEAQESGGQEDMSLQSEEQGITVTSREEFMEALAQRRSLIIINNLISIGEDAEESGRMLPVKIPAGTVIQGSSPDSRLCSRSPIQLEGDGVCFRDIELTFESSSALGSVPHRELYLAGHSLTLDNVSTWLKGGAGGMGGQEEELLPTVYAGGYTGTDIGGSASMTVINSNDKTIFQAVYMGHEAGVNGDVPYKGSAELNLDAKAVVRESVDTQYNSQAEIHITGINVSQYAMAKSFNGNVNTTLTLSNVSMEKAVLNEIGNLVLKDGACLAPETGYLNDVTLQSGACLDLNGVTDAENVMIEGDFHGVSDPQEARGILVLNPEGFLSIMGEITGTTQFQTQNRLFPGALLKRGYIWGSAGSGADPAFVLSPKYAGTAYGRYLFERRGEIWTVCDEEEEVLREIGRVEIQSFPQKVDLNKIAEKADGSIPDEDIYIEATWYDTEGTPFSHLDVIDPGYLLYEADYVLRVRSEYWESDSADVQNRTDWGQAVSLMASEDYPGRYFLQAFDGASPGDFTFLFCSEVSDPATVADVKALGDTVKAETRITFYDGDGTEPEKPVEPEKPAHKHTYQSEVTKKASCAEAGVRTYTCGCGDSYTERIAPSGHRYIEKRVPATMKKSGKVQKVCSVCSGVGDTVVIYSPKKITWSKTSYSYDGKVKTPSVVIKDSKGRTLKAGTDYRITYPKGRKNPGIYTAAITFRGNYSGKTTGSFTIKPKKTSLKKVTAKSKGLQATWKKQTTQMDGYQVQYSTSSGFKGKTTRTVTIKKSSSAKTISRLKGKKKYYVRIRTYKTVKVNGKKQKLYSDWSGKKSVYTKK